MEAKMGRTVLITFLQLILLFLSPCRTTNVQVESSDGGKHVFEMKTMEKIGAFVLCSNCKGYAAGSLPTPSALRFNVKFQPAGEVVSACETHREELPAGLCTYRPGQQHSTETAGSCSKHEMCLSNVDHRVLAEDIVKKNLLPFPSGDTEADIQVAHAIVELNAGKWDEAVAMLSSILNKSPSYIAAHYARGVAYARKAKTDPHYIALAVKDFTICIEHEPTHSEGFERRAEVFITSNQFKEALEDLKIALKIRASVRLRFSCGIVNLLLENFADAEQTFKENLEAGQKSKGPVYMMSYFHLGLSQYYQGRLRSAIEVFKEVMKLQPNNVEACVSLAQAFYELGNLKAAYGRFEQARNMDPNHTLSLQLMGIMQYHAGDTLGAKETLQKCMKVDPDNNSCQYSLALANVAMGQFYQGKIA